MKKYLLGIDIGTSSCKIAIFCTDGKVQSETNKEHKTYYPAPGWVEQDPEEWWINICNGIKECLDASAIHSNQIVSVGIAGQGWSAIPVDEYGNSLARTPIWMDTRASDITNKMMNEIGAETIFDVSGNSFLPSYTTPKIIWFKEEYPEIYEKTNCFLQSNSFIGMKLTGKLSVDKSQNYGVHFYNPKSFRYDESLANQLGIDINKVAPIFECHDVIGTITENASDKTGLTVGTPVVAGGLDAACGTLGAGVYQPNQTQIQGGQAGGMSICLDRPLTHEQLIFSPHVVPGLWLLQGGTVGGGGVLRWFKDQLASEETFDELTDLAADIAPGAEGVLFLPYMAGERCPIWNPDAKAVFYGLGFDKSKKHMIRAALEGVVFSVYHNLKIAEEKGIDIKKLDYRAMGGVANSHTWIQIYADVFGAKMSIPNSDTATTLGAAILAGVGVGVYDDFTDAVERTIGISRVQKPNEEVYDTYQNVFKNYLKLSSTYTSII